MFKDIQQKKQQIVKAQFRELLAFLLKHGSQIVADESYLGLFGFDLLISSLQSLLYSTFLLCPPL